MFGLYFLGLLCISLQSAASENSQQQMVENFDTGDYIIPAHDVLVLCPSAILHVHSLSLWILLFCYISLGLTAFLFVMYNIYTSHTMRDFRKHLFSLKTGFCFFSFTLCALRTWHLIQWSPKDRYSILVYVGCEEAPLYVQVVLYFMMAIFIGRVYSSIVPGSRLIQGGIITAAIVILTVMAFVLTGLCVLLSIITKQWQHEFISRVDYFYELPNALLFGVSFLLALVFLFRILIVINRKRGKMALDWSTRVRLHVLIAVAFVYFILAMGRSLYQLLDFIGINPIQKVISYWMREDFRWYYWSYLIFYLTFEVLPTYMLLMAFVGWRLRDVSRKSRRDQ